MRSAVVHCHFYQPPREDPWSEGVVPESSAAPFRDWNERITHECYEPFASARTLDQAGHVTGRVNLYESVSFDVGSTLMRWLEPNAPAVYRAILKADRSSSARLNGHGNAIAMPYNHLILPLASRRDKVTEVRWGLADFRRRFGRDAEGLWLPETAADEETLVVLAEEGVRFTVLAPQQLENLTATGLPLKFDAGGGRSLAIFSYDGALANDAAFGRVLEDGGDLARRLLSQAIPGFPAAVAPHVVSLALDGETFGHHRKFAEMALASALAAVRADERVHVENYASILERIPPMELARVVEPSSWSCVHGVERWRADCPCGIAPGASHAWRRPLRAALNWLAREVDARFEDSGLFTSPWKVRDAFGSAAGLTADVRAKFARKSVRVSANAPLALRLLEAERMRLAMFASCAWFFDDATGHEVELVLRFAARAIDELGDDQLEPAFLERLALARSGDPDGGDAATLFRSRVLPLRAGGRP